MTAALAFAARLKTEEFGLAVKLLRIGGLRRVIPTVEERGVPPFREMTAAKERLRQRERERSLPDAVRTDEKKTSAEPLASVRSRELERDLVATENSLPTQSRFPPEKPPF